MSGFDPDALTRYFKSREVFSGLRVESDLFFVRCDGRNFRKFSKFLGLDAFDSRFRDAFLETAKMFLASSGFDIGLVYFFSDELNYFVVRAPFGGRVEKIDSVFASHTSSLFTIAIYKRFNLFRGISFDARVIPIDGVDEAYMYLVWRQMDNFRNFLNKMAQIALQKNGLSAREVSEALKGFKARKLLEIIEERFGPIDKFPSWQRYGDLVYFKEVEKRGFDKKKNLPIVVKRKNVVVESFDFRKNREKLVSIIENAIPKEQ